MRGATLFSGGVEALLKQHIDFVHAAEYEPAIAAVYRANHGDHVQVADVCAVDYTPWGQLDYLHASPVCKNASQAKTGGEESDTDIRTAQAVVRCLEATQPRVFTLENVGGYQRFRAYRLICQALDRMGYMWHAEVLNAADFGVPQTRRRLILRAVKDALLPGLPAPLPWVGWYAAIEDLLPTLPESQFAAWQLARLPEGLREDTLFHGGNARSEEKGGMTMIKPVHPAFTLGAGSENGGHRAFIMGNNDSAWGAPYRTAEQPMLGMTTQTGARARAFLMTKTADKYGDGVRDEAEPAHTIAASAHGTRAFLVNGENMSRELTIRDAAEPSYVVGASAHGSARAWLSQGRVVKMTPRALARFQSLPDSFVLPEKNALACTVIGNAVPALLMEQIVRPLL